MRLGASRCQPLPPHALPRDSGRAMSGDRANQVYVKGFGRRRFHFPESGLHRSLTRLDPKAVVDRDEGAASTSPLEELGNDLSSWNREAAAAAPYDDQHRLKRPETLSLRIFDFKEAFGNQTCPALGGATN